MNDQFEVIDAIGKRGKVVGPQITRGVAALMKSVRVLRLGCDVGNRRVVAIRLAKQDLIGHRVAGVRVPGFAAKVPDQKHVFVTAGYGTFRNTGQFATKPGGRFASNDYVTAAVTPDGALGMAYLPQGGTITVDLRKLKHNVTARWFDPSANTFQAIAAVAPTSAKATAGRPKLWPGRPARRWPTPAPSNSPRPAKTVAVSQTGFCSWKPLPNEVNDPVAPLLKGCHYCPSMYG